MIDEKTEQLLTQTAWSDKEAEQFFKERLCDEELMDKILDVLEESESGDARMEAAFWISKFSTDIITKAEARLLPLMEDEWESVAVHIMMALSRIQSAQALEKILEQRIKPKLYWEAMALRNYFRKADETAAL